MTVGEHYEAAAHPVREDIAAAHATILDHLAGAGRWLTGAERIGLAEQVRAARTCGLCATRKAALSPYASEEEHADVPGLRAPLVDLAHRITTDAARLTRAWFDRIVGAGVSTGEYAEAVGVIGRVVALDTFARALGLPPLPLPAPRDGAPSREVVEGAKDNGAWLHTVKRRGIPNVGIALSQAPEAMLDARTMSRAHYVPVREITNMAFDPGRSISRAQMELVAAAMSKANECFY